VDGPVGRPGVRREVTTVPEAEVTLADGGLTVKEGVVGVEMGLLVVRVVGSPGVVSLVIGVEVTVVVLDKTVGDVVVESMLGVDEVTARVADVEVELAGAIGGVTGPPVVPLTGVSVVEETGRRGVEEVEMSGPETDVDGTVTLTAVEGAADSEEDDVHVIAHRESFVG